MTRGYAPAREQQLVADANDDILTILARSRQPRVKHWWGRRSWSEANLAAEAEGIVNDYEVIADLITRTGAWCYLCLRPITTWSSRSPMTEQARAAVHLHRLEHIRDDLDVVTVESEGKQ